MITIMDYGIGNIRSVTNAFELLRIPYSVIRGASEYIVGTPIVLPGVGQASCGMNNLKMRGFVSVLLEQVSQGVPLLGICLGMQLLFEKSSEGNVSCLSILGGNVRKYSYPVKVPQVGWNTVTSLNESKLLKEIDNGYFYFVNSYFAQPTCQSDVKGVTEYGGNFCSVVERGNVCGVQFHPEKSGNTGMRVIQNFFKEICTS